MDQPGEGNMHPKLSILMKRAIIFNVILTLFVLTVHIYYLGRIIESNNLINSVMEEKQVIRDTAIRMLEKEGIEIIIGDGITHPYGVLMCIITLTLLYMYSKNNEFFPGFFAAFCGVFTTVLGGFILFYVFLSLKSEKVPGKINISANKWQKYIHEKSVLS